MTENQVFALVQAFRAIVNEKYKWALGTSRYDWLAPPTDQEQNFVIKMNISLQEVVGNGKRGRLEACEVLSTLFGWNPGTTTDALWEAYEDLKKKLGRGKGNADRAYDEIRNDARRIWGLGSTKDLYLAELSALIEWLEEHNGVVALQKVAQAPKEWAAKLERVDAVKRPDNYVPPAAMTGEDASGTPANFDAPTDWTAEEMYGPAFDGDPVPEPIYHQDGTIERDTDFYRDLGL